MSVSVEDAFLKLEREQIRGLVPDNATARSADELARSDRWGETGRSAFDIDGGVSLIWAEFPEARREPTRTLISIPCLRTACTCAATRHPCRHVIALLLRDGDEPFADTALPDWAAGLFEDHHSKSAGDGQPGDGRVAALVAGMAELKKWLGDLASGGLGDLPKRGRAPWLAAADRLSDAYAVETTRELREMATVPGAVEDWAERVLPRLGRLALLCEAFERFDELSAAERGDALLATGFTPAPGDDVDDVDDVVGDTWLVAGRRFESLDRQLRARAWLYGVSSGRWAMLTASGSGGRMPGQCLPVGAAVSGEIAFYPATRPLSGIPVRPLRLVAGGATAAGAAESGIDKGIAGYAAALAANPWLRVYPLALRDVYCEPPGTRPGDAWRLRDRAGWLLPLPPKFAHGWHLLSLTADRPMTLFGEWDGARFTPLSVFDGRWRSMSGWRGIP